MIKTFGRVFLLIFPLGTIFLLKFIKIPLKMNNLIQIMQTPLNGAEVNSVSAKELYKALELGQGQFQRWINKNLIDNHFFHENEDYMRVRLNVVGNDTSDYILSLDVAKHLSMMAKTDVAHKLRNYFIEIEKQSQKVLTVSEQISLMAQGHQGHEERLNTIEHKIDNDIPLTSAQKHSIKQKVNLLVYRLKDSHNLQDDFIPKCYSRVWKKVKNHFVVSSYMEIPKNKFDELVSVIDSVCISDVV